MFVPVDSWVWFYFMLLVPNTLKHKIKNTMDHWTISGTCHSYIFSSQVRPQSSKNDKKTSHFRIPKRPKNVLKLKVGQFSAHSLPSSSSSTCRSGQVVFFTAEKSQMFLGNCSFQWESSIWVVVSVVSQGGWICSKHLRLKWQQSKHCTLFSHGSCQADNSEKLFELDICPKDKTQGSKSKQLGALG